MAVKKYIVYLIASLALLGFYNARHAAHNNNSTLPMSSTQLKIISIQPSYVPGKKQQDDAKTLLQKIYGNQLITLDTTKDIQFVDQGANFDSVSCNLCGKNIEVDTWQDAMDIAAKAKFTNLSFITPCCHKTTSLNKLNYTWPAGFAKFAIVIEDAQKEIPAIDLQQLENVLGTKLRIIWAHY
jgi:hypothetical protein